MKKMLVASMVTLMLMASAMSVGAWSLYGSYGFRSGGYVGERAWAEKESPYKEAGAKIVEGNYDSGWKFGRDVTVKKLNNPLKTCYGYAQFK